ncbi:MAG: HD domain-containing phosphohydrolase [Anaerolineales bacterium]
MRKQAYPTLLQPVKNKIQASPLLQRLWHWFIEPSPKITQPDERRQATLMTGCLLGAILLTIMNKVVFGSFSDWSVYAGYEQTIPTVLILAFVYALSRTQYRSLAAILAVLIGSIAIFAIAWTEPKATLRGVLDYLILPLWLGSILFDLKKLALLIGAMLLALLGFSFVAPETTLNFILIGPFAFTLTTSVLLLVITRHRNRLEQDRQAELSAKEQRTRRQADRADALLRVAGRFNAQLDLEAVLAAIGEEVSHALNAPASVVMLYDREQNLFYATTGAGLAPDLIKNLPHFPRTVYEETVKALGTLFSLPDLQAIPDNPYRIPFQKANLHSIAFATMEYGHELIGNLSALTLGDQQRNFTQEELLLLQGLADQAALALVNTRLYKDARRRLERLQALRIIDAAIATNRNLRENLEVLLDKITGQLKVDSAVFLLFDETTQQLEFATSLGFRTPTLRFTRLRLGEGMAGRAALQKEIIHIQDLRADPQTLVNAPTLAQEGFVSYYAAPLIARGQIKGVLEIFHRSPHDPDEEWLSFLEALADQAAIAIENTSLFQDLQHANDELSQAYDSTIEGWSHALDLRDKETEGHTQRVTKMTLQLAQAMGLSKAELVHIRRGALLHDIGKMGVPDGILLKPGALNDDEWKIMRRHPQLAYEMLAPIAYLKPALDIPYCHHEKWDGAGYPRGLKGEQIPVAARIFAVIDVYDALTSDRPYRQAWSQEKTLEHIRSLAGTHFEPRVVDIFLRTMRQGVDEN